MNGFASMMKVIKFLWCFKNKSGNFFGQFPLKKHPLSLLHRNKGGTLWLLSWIDELVWFLSQGRSSTTEFMSVLWVTLALGAWATMQKFSLLRGHNAGATGRIHRKTENSVLTDSNPWETLSQNAQASHSQSPNPRNCERSEKMTVVVNH